MIVSISNAAQATYIFIAILIAGLLLSARARKDKKFFPIEVTNELKGVAILLVVFGHVGYFLTTDNSFLFPLSTIAGVGVDIFLFLSGYGLVVSALNKPRSISQFYKDRLLKLLIPFWIVISIFFILDFFVLNKAYPVTYVIASFLGFFYRADLYQDLNSPLWYFTLILFYYFVFPLVFIKKRPWLSAIAIYFITSVFIACNPSWFSQVRYFHEVHMLAFPVGVLAGQWLARAQGVKQIAVTKLENKIKPHQVSRLILNIIYCLILVFLCVVIGYNALHSGVGQSIHIERLISLITTLAFVLFFLIKKIEFRLMHLIGLYSYEIYLLHWPIMNRYDFVFQYLHPWLAMAVYIGIFIGAGWLLQKVSRLIVNKISLIIK